MADDNNKWSRPDAPPPPLFLGKKERDLVKQVNDELIEKVIGQPPIRVYALVEWGGSGTTTTSFGIDKTASLIIHFHSRRLNEDQNVNVQEGDFVLYDGQFYEIVTTSQPRRLFGQDDYQVEISATCIEARSGVFNGE